MMVWQEMFPIGSFMYLNTWFQVGALCGGGYGTFRRHSLVAGSMSLGVGFEICHSSHFLFFLSVSWGWVKVITCSMLQPPAAMLPTLLWTLAL